MSQQIVEIRLKKISKTFVENEMIEGVLYIESKQELSHQGINLTLSGCVNLEISGKTHGRFDAIYNSVKPIQLSQKSIELSKPGRVPAGAVEIPFSLPLQLSAPPTSGIKRLLETYRGVFINISYNLVADIKRSLLQKSIITQMDVLVQYRDSNIQKDDIAEVKPVKFQMTPQAVMNVANTPKLPNFSIVGVVDSCEVAMKQPITGHIIIENCDRPIKSIELQLVRVETCGCAEGYSKDSTEIENLQMADGNVPRNLEIPLYLLLPRLFTCPSTSSINFRIDFELVIVVLFADNHLVTESLPLKITRF